jgi:hypothetical protein
MFWYHFFVRSGRSERGHLGARPIDLDLGRHIDGHLRFPPRSAFPHGVPFLERRGLRAHRIERLREDANGVARGVGLLGRRIGERHQVQELVRASLRAPRCVYQRPGFRLGVGDEATDRLEGAVEFLGRTVNLAVRSSLTGLPSCRSRVPRQRGGAR